MNQLQKNLKSIKLGFITLLISQVAKNANNPISSFCLDFVTRLYTKKETFLTAK